MSQVLVFLLALEVVQVVVQEILVVNTEVLAAEVLLLVKDGVVIRHMLVFIQSVMMLLMEAVVLVKMAHQVVSLLVVEVEEELDLAELFFLVMVHTQDQMVVMVAMDKLPSLGNKFRYQV